MTPMTEAAAHAVWDVLVAHAGANDGNWERNSFVRHQTSTVEREWRFQGVLGFGGKFRRQRVWDGDDYAERWYVDCYPEDETDARRAAIETTNAALAELTKETTPMNETDVLDPDTGWLARLVADIIIDQTGACDGWCDHCRHGDHRVCDEWFRDVCRCPHDNKASEPR